MPVLPWSFLLQLHHFPFPPAIHKCSNFSISSPTFVIFDNNDLNVCEVAFHIGSELYSVITSGIEPLFTCLLTICISLEKHVFMSFAHY